MSKLRRSIQVLGVFGALLVFCTSELPDTGSILPQFLAQITGLCLVIAAIAISQPKRW